MPLLHKAVSKLSNRMPKVISPKAHAIIDYVTAGSFFLTGALFWSRSKPAAISAFICGAAEAGVAMVTDYPGGVAKLISFSTHGNIDAGFSGVIASMPNLMGFGDDSKANFFRAQGVAMAAVTGMTDFERIGEYRRRAA